MCIISGKFFFFYISAENNGLQYGIGDGRVDTNM